jgi:hypothetical protein
VQVLLKAEIVEPVLELPERPLDRQEDGSQALLDVGAAQEPEPSRHYPSDEQHCERK